MDEKIRFIETFHGDVFNFTELCALFRIARKTRYKWLDRAAVGEPQWRHPQGCGWVNVSQVLSEDYVGIEEVDDGVWSVYFGPLLLGRFDERDLELHGGYPYNKPLWVLPISLD